MSCKHQYDPEHVLVIVPTLGEREDLLERNLDSIERSGVKVCTVVVDSSKSGVVEKSSSKLQVIRSKPQGLSAALNLGLRMSNCSSRFLAWIGDDDFYEPGGLRALVDVLKANSGASFAFGSCRYIDSEGRTMRVLRSSPMTVFLTKYLNTLIAQPSTLISREFLNENNFLREDLRYTMDLDLWIRLIRLGKPVKVSEICSSYTWHSGSLSSSGQALAISEALSVRKFHFGSLMTIGSQIMSFAARLRLYCGNSALDRASKFRHDLS